MGRPLMFGALIGLAAIPLAIVEAKLWLYKNYWVPASQTAQLAQLSQYFDQLFLLIVAMLSLAIILCLIDLLIRPLLFGSRHRKIRHDPIEGKRIGIGLTAYNDELSVGGAVADFKKLSGISDLVVIDNNSRDRTAELAQKAGARVVQEKKQGYGYACMRAMSEPKCDIVILSEADQTFSASDVKKLIAYMENADMVVGTRTTEELLDQSSQLDWFLNWGNQFLAKLIQLRYWGKVRLTDVGCTYRAIRKDAFLKIQPQLKVGGSHFSPHMVMVALENDLKVIEVPITFRERVGQSKAIGRNKIKAIKLGLQMLWMEIFS
ncbi:Glycosyltransferase AglJ [Candidatus Gugararchaeum adminiculabundum]|nr:Glycosyltransferase AglJ [Candidatus Gugararchaeum adminiculabundum]